MAPDTPASTPPEDEGRAEALAGEVRELRQLLIALQADLKPSIQSSLRERSSELQRLGGELSDQEAAARSLRVELDDSLRRVSELEEDVERWRDAARRGVDEVARKARETAERFERQTAELSEALSLARSQLEASRTLTRSMTQARDAALKEAERRKARILTLRTRIVRREARKVRSLSWRITAPLRWLERTSHRWLLRGARLRRRLFKR